MKRLSQSNVPARLESLESRTHLAAQLPFPNDTPAAIPGTVEAENYDRGGEGISYHDTTSGNVTQVYRSDDVDVEGVIGSLNVGHIRSGEWLEFSVNVVESGTYRIEASVASNNSGGRFRISVDAVNKTGSLTLPYTGGWHTWKLVTKSGVSLAGGTHVVRLTIESSASGGDVGNIDFIRFVKTSTSNPTDFNPRPLTWVSKATNPLRREEAQSLVYNGKLYQLGGYDGNFQASHRVDVYDPATNRWSRKRDMPYNITHAAVAADPDGRSFWFVGGFLGSFQQNGGASQGPPATGRVYKYDAATDSWSTQRSLPQAQAGGGAGIIDRKLYFFGGADKSRTFDRSEGYMLDLDDLSSGWQRIADTPNPRNHLGGIVAGGKIYAIGGQYLLEDEGVATNRVHRYDPATNTWTQVASMPLALSHYNASTVLFDRYIITVGGENPHNVAQPYVFAYDTVLDRWARLTNLPNPRRAGVAGLIGTKLIQSTGYNRSQGETATTYIADLANTFT